MIAVFMQILIMHVVFEQKNSIGSIMAMHSSILQTLDNVLSHILHKSHQLTQ